MTAAGSPLYSAGGGYLNPSSNYLGVNDVKVDGEICFRWLGVRYSLSKTFF
jgi:hypothetical protein